MPSLSPSLRVLAIALALVTARGSTAGAAAPGEVSSAGLRTIRTTDGNRQEALTRGSAWSAFRARHANWSVIWNEATGTPHRAFGRGIALRGFADTPEGVDRAVRGFVAENGALFGITPTLERTAAHPVGNLWYVRYRQTFGGLPVFFSSWEFRVSRDGKLVLFGADARTPSAAVLAAPRIGSVVAREAAKSGLGFDPARDRVESDALGLLPVAGARGDDYRLVYAVRLTMPPRGNWIALVDAASGEVLWRHNHVFYSSAKDAPILHGGPTAGLGAIGGLAATESSTPPNQVLATISGQATGTIHPSLPTDGLSTQPFSGLYVTVASTQTVTNASGTYSMTTCSGTSNVTADLNGLYCMVDRVDVTNGDAHFAGSATCPGTRSIGWTGTNSQSSERDAYYHVNKAHDWIKAIDPAYTASDHPVTMSVNSIDDECVAYWNGVSITYGSEGSFCPYNMATMPDIIYRQYAQRVNDELYFAEGASFGMTSGCLQGATADLMAAFMTDNSTIGDGIEGAGTYLRDVNNTRRWPEDESTDGNECGLILAGAFWDLRNSLGLTTAARLLHFAKYGLPGEAPPPVADDGAAMTDYFVETLVADDNDNDVSNGTPHFAQLVAAFNAHGIGTNNFLVLSHTPFDDQITNGPFPVTATIQYNGPVGGLDPSSPRLYYAINTLPWESAAMTPTGNPDEWGAEIPAQSGSIVKYYISATETYGGTHTSPGGAPSRMYTFIAGPASTIQAWDMESNPGWTVTNSSGSVTGTWERGDPVSDGTSSPEDDHTPGGTMCWVTGQASPGATPGTNDVDDGSTTLTSGTFNALQSGIHFPILSYYRWYSNNAGEAPGSDFWKVEISNNNGSSWVPVENTLQTDQSWRRVLFFIKDYVTPTANMKIRFVATDTGSGSLIEAAVDDLTLYGYFDNVAVGDGPRSASLALAPPSPNPFQRSTRIRYTLPAAGNVDLVAYDLHGRVVRRLAGGTQPAGAHDALWDGRDDAGRMVPSGPYFLRLVENGEKRSIGVVRIK